VYGVGSNGNYWSSSLSTGNVIYGRILNFGNGYVDWQGSSDRYFGLSVRGVVDE
jgi:hypothetical protein